MNSTFSGTSVLYRYPANELWVWGENAIVAFATSQ